MENSSMTELFKNRVSQWVRYSDYTIIEENGNRYITPAPGARLSIYDPLANAEEIVTDFLNYGKELYPLKFGKRAEEISLEIASKYGLLGWMTALPKDDAFSTYEETYLGVNGVLFDNRRIMETEEYIRFFTTHGSQKNDPAIAYAMRRGDIYNTVFSPRYREPLLWSAALAEGLYAHFQRSISQKNCEDSANGDPESPRMATTYTHPGITLQMWTEDSPEMLWSFDSLKTMAEVAYCVFLSADTHPLRICKHCGKIYYHTHSRNEFCSPRCRNQWNVYRSRKRIIVNLGKPPE